MTFHWDSGRYLIHWLSYETMKIIEEVKGERKSCTHYTWFRTTRSLLHGWVKVGSAEFFNISVVLVQNSNTIGTHSRVRRHSSKICLTYLISHIYRLNKPNSQFIVTQHNHIKLNLKINLRYISYNSRDIFFIIKKNHSWYGNTLTISKILKNLEIYGSQVTYVMLQRRGRVYIRATEILKLSRSQLVVPIIVVRELGMY